MRKTHTSKRMRRKQKTQRRKQHGGAEYETLSATVTNDQYLSLDNDTKYYYDENCIHHKISKEEGDRRREEAAKWAAIFARKEGIEISEIDYNLLPEDQKLLWKKSRTVGPQLSPIQMYTPKTNRNLVPAPSAGAGTALPNMLTPPEGAILHSEYKELSENVQDTYTKAHGSWVKNGTQFFYVNLTTHPDHVKYIKQRR